MILLKNSISIAPGSAYPPTYLPDCPVFSQSEFSPESAYCLGAYRQTYPSLTANPTVFFGESCFFCLPLKPVQLRDFLTCYSTHMTAEIFQPQAQQRHFLPVHALGV
jgi:hypothetical protein